MSEDFERQQLRDMQSANNHRAQAAEARNDMDAKRDAMQAEDLETHLRTRARLEMAALVQDWVMEAAYLEPGESLAHWFAGALCGVVDANDDGELDEAELALLDIYCDAAWDFMAEAGVSESDFWLLVDDRDDSAARRIVALLATTLPLASEDEQVQDFIDFALAEPGSEPAYDAASKGGQMRQRVPSSWAKTHRGKETVHSKHGKRKLTNHRKKWKKASALQQATLKKARTRAHTSAAVVFNVRSNKLTRTHGGRQVLGGKRS